MENFIFDLYGTLADIKTNEKKAYLFEKMVLFYAENGAFYTKEEWKREYLRLCDKEKKHRLQIRPDVLPDINLQTVFAELFRQRGIEETGAVSLEAAHIYRLISTAYVRTYDGVKEMLCGLRKKGKKVYLLSNAQGVFTRPELRAMGLLPYFNGICISSEEEAIKPDPYFYNALFMRYHLKKEESVMIGNDPAADIKGAADFGIASIYIHSNLSPESFEPLMTDWRVMDGSIEKLANLLDCHF